ncbi:MAG: hypothetical protein CH6_2547 [Candidatus Kapaibacterium sp.]|nr:MAG: hypothetical protein CH6_2547 [Candidatus Kapabacteria bacterium]
MDYRRYTINELARETKTSKHLLYDWVRRGLLVPTQISGTRKKFSIDAFLEAERKALKELQQKELERFVTSPRPNEKIPEAFYDNLLKEIQKETPLKASRRGKTNNGVTNNACHTHLSHKIREIL